MYLILRSEMRSGTLTLSAAAIPLFTHLIPILFFVFMMMDVLLRNSKRTEHRLVFAIIFCCMMLFLEEFVRHYVPIAYSPIISTAWFSTSGIMITGLGLHLFIKLTGLDRRMPRYLFPYFCYLSVVFVLANLLFNDQMISGNEFHEVGIWKLPVYNSAYYIAMIGSNCFNVLYLIILHKGKTNAGSTRGLRDIYNLLMLGVIVTAFFNLVVGLIDFQGYLPPYPYIYGGFAWCLLLRHTMLKYDFLNHADKRYEKLFNLNPAAIMLIDRQGNMKEANPSARQLFGAMQLDHSHIYEMLDDEIKRRIRARAQISHYEMTIQRGSKRFDVLIDGDYVLTEYDPQVLLIMRDVTVQKENERELTFLAYHDPLTRLPNRRYFFEKLDGAILEAGRHGHKLALVVFDIDFFKEINDQYGHHVGDEALEYVANMIRKVILPAGVAARLGGDEFVFFLNPATSAELAAVKAKIHQLQQALEENALVVNHASLPIRLSIGVSFYPDNGANGMSLINSADKALYYVKRHGRNQLNVIVES